MKAITRTEGAPESVGIKGLKGPRRVILVLEYYSDRLEIVLKGEQADALLEALAEWKVSDHG